MVRFDHDMLMFTMKRLNDKKPSKMSCHTVFTGLHLIEVTFDEVSVPKSPFRVSVTEGCDPSRVRAYGPGLEEGLVNKPNRFTVETR